MAEDTTERKSRVIKAPEERHKRGRWVLPLLLVLSVLAASYFWWR